MPSEISNGTTVPHAANYSDLLNKVIAFAIGTGDWQIVSDQLSANNEIYLKGLDYSGDKNIHIGIKRYANPGADIYGWQLQGYTGYTNAGFFLNPGAISGNIPVLPLWNDIIPYWLFVNPRRILLVARLSGVYVSMYMGLMLPYGSIGQWSYPLVVGGSSASYDTFGNMSRYSDTSNYMCVPYIPIGDGNRSGCMVRVPTGQWLRLVLGASLFNSPGYGDQMWTVNGISPYCDKWTMQGQQNYGLRQIRPNLDGAYPLKPLRVMRGDTPDALGILDGVKFIPGYNLSTEDTITEGSDEYIAFQDTFRTDLFNFFAVKNV